MTRQSLCVLLAGGAVTVFALSAGAPPAPHAAAARPARLDTAGLVSLRQLREVVVGQAATLSGELRRCREAARLRRGCVWMPMARGEVAARLNATIAFALARRVRDGSCRQAMLTLRATLSAVGPIVRDTRAAATAPALVAGVRAVAAVQRSLPQAAADAVAVCGPLPPHSPVA